MAKRPRKKVYQHGPQPEGPIRSDVELAKVTQWYNLTYERPALMKAFKEYAKNEFAYSFKDSDVNRFVIDAAGVYAKMILDGQPLPARSKRWLDDKTLFYITQATNDNEQKETKKPDVPKRSPAEEKLSMLIGDIDVAIDKLEEFSAYDFLKKEEASAPMLSKLLEYYTPILEEVVAAKTGTDKELKEAYSNLKPRTLTKLVKFIQAIVDDLKLMTTAKKAQRKTRAPRKKKQVDVTKNIQVLAEHKDLKIASISPAKVIGASVVYLYNVKYNSMTQVVPEDGKQLTFNGKSLINFKAVSRSVRAKKKNLGEVSDMGKVSIRKFFEGLTGKPNEVTANRINMNENVVILKAF